MNQTLGLDRHHGSPLIRRIATIVPLTDEEQDALAGLTRSPRSFAKGKELVDLGENDSDPFVLLDGFVIASRTNGTGERLIVDLLIPGDIANIRSIVLERTDMHYSAATAVTLSRFGARAYYDLLTVHQRLGVALMFTNAVDRSTMAERLYSVARRNGYQRLGHFLLELLIRMQRAGLAVGNSFRAPLTLAILADLLGMRLEHVSRLMQRLRRDGHIRTERDLIVFPALREMAKACDFDPSYLHMSETPPTLPKAIGGELRAAS